jgi:hypothetical protein
MNDILSPTRRAARRLRFVTLAGVAVLALLILFAVAMLVAGAPVSDTIFVRIEHGGLPPLPAAAVLAAVGLLVGIALLRLARMLHRVEQGVPFGAARDLRGFAFYLLLAVLASILLPPLLQMALGHGNGADGPVAFTLGGGEALMLLVTGLLFFVARLLDEAQRLADDHSQIV